ncbi:hypothetical protein LJC00_04455 [Dysgonomonas sp. OttesenSCG-928-M03]|nr:hypothetical protein [Dysgonomonas sp. OttesenSCG-928-M03]
MKKIHLGGLGIVLFFILLSCVQGQSSQKRYIVVASYDYFYKNDSYISSEILGIEYVDTTMNITHEIERDTLWAKTNEEAYLIAYKDMVISLFSFAYYGGEKYRSNLQKIEIFNEQNVDIIPSIDFVDRKQKEEQIWESEKVSFIEMMDHKEAEDRLYLQEMKRPIIK